MQNVVHKFSLSKPEQVVVSPQGICFCTTNTWYKWEAIVEIRLYITKWNWEDLVSNLEIRFSNNDGFRVNDFRAEIHTAIYQGLATYLVDFDIQQAEILSMNEFSRKEKYLRFLGLFTNFYWGCKPIVFSSKKLLPSTSG